MPADQLALSAGRENPSPTSQAMGVPNGISPSPPALPRWTVAEAPSDPILELNTLFKNDPDPRALNLGVGAYRDAHGQPHEFRAVAKARALLSKRNTLSNHQYLPISGSPTLNDSSARLVFGDALVDSGDVATVQTISGSGALRVALEFCQRTLGCTRVLVPDPTWANHSQMVPDAGLALERYRYYDAERGRVDARGMLQDVWGADERCVVVLQPCAHNPTGADVPDAAWRDARDAARRRRWVPLFDMAYQGLASGDVERDAYAVRLFAADVPTMVAQSYSKNMGLYNARVGTLSVATAGFADVARNAASQLKWIIRTMYSSPPAYGARVVETVLGEPRLRAEWLAELQEMVGRMREMREALHAGLRRRGVAGGWEHVVRTRGMFVWLGLTGVQVERMREVHHVYMTRDSRINVAGLTRDTVDQLADAIAEVVQFCDGA